MSSVLYDAQGPRAKRRNVLLTVVFLVVFAALLWWVFSTLNDKGQLEWALWKPFFTGTEAWSTYIWPGLQNTLKAAALAVVIALPLGAALGIARLSDHKWVRVPAAVVVEFFRSIPVLVLMIFGLALFAEYTNVSSDDRPLYAVVTGLVLYNASVLAEIVRSGILALPRGQAEGAMAIGLRKGQGAARPPLAVVGQVRRQRVGVVQHAPLEGGAQRGFEVIVGHGRLARRQCRVSVGGSAGGFHHGFPFFDFGADEGVEFRGPLDRGHGAQFHDALLHLGVGHGLLDGLIDLVHDGRRCSGRGQYAKP